MAATRWGRYTLTLSGVATPTRARAPALGAPRFCATVEYVAFGIAVHFSAWLSTAYLINSNRQKYLTCKILPL